MILEIDDWVFDIDMAATMEYSANEAQEHCTCVYCRNFYAAVDQYYPDLRPFLAKFGLDIEAPDELMAFTSTHIMNLYAVSGKILTVGNGPVSVSGLRVDPQEWKVSMINTECPKPLFVLSVGPFDIPWVLDEPCDDDTPTVPQKQSWLGRFFGNKS